MTPENLRWHAAGHLAAAVSLIDVGNTDGARTVLGVVKAFLEAPGVDNPPAFRETVARAIADPANEKDNIAALEALFCSPHNAPLDGMRMGKG
jgi:hypothetical protein